tara:strand:+ start:461 stop:664 length:204 start_codon:yes stop_codon:yes gene_type:complete
MISEKFKEVLAALQEAEKDSEKCDKGNASAGRRLRKACLAAMKDLKELRSHIIADMKERQADKDEQW